MGTLKFEVGKTYESKLGKSYKIVSIENGLATLRFGKSDRKAVIKNFCGVQEIVLNFGDDRILSHEIVPVEDPTIEYGYVQEYKINDESTSYIDLFKSLRKQ